MGTAFNAAAGESGTVIRDTALGTTWCDVLRGAATGQVILAAFMLAITVVFEGRFDPFPVVIGVIVAGGVVWLSLLVVTILGLVATVGALQRKAGPAAEVAPKVAGAFIAILVVVGVIAGALTGSATRMTGDLALQAKQFEFTETDLTAEPGRVSVFVENEDVAAHDFTIKGVVAIDLPGQRAGRGSFDVDAGTYRFYCSLHPDMEGTLKVS